MTTTIERDGAEAVTARTTVAVNASAAALAWLNAFLATSQDDDRPALYRTLSVEFFDAGVQFIATDGTVLFRTFVPAVRDERPGEWPPIDEEPNDTVVVSDVEQFGLGFIRALQRVANEEENAYQTIVMTVEPVDSLNLSLGDSFAPHRLTLRSFGQRIDLQLRDETYPDWRRLRFGLSDAERVEGMTLSPRILGLIGKLKGVHSADLEFHGQERYIAFTATGAESEVRGMLAPMKRQKQSKE